MDKKKAKSSAELKDNAMQAANFLKRLANENRLMILCSLMEGELSVGELNELIPLSQSALSQHLSALRDAELVITRRESQTIFYQLNGSDAIQIIKALQSIFC